MERMIHIKVCGSCIINWRTNADERRDPQAMHKCIWRSRPRANNAGTGICHLGLEIWDGMGCEPRLCGCVVGVSVVMAFISAGCSGRALEVTRRSSETRNLFLGPLDGARKIWEVIHSSERRMATIAGLDSLFVCLWCGDLGAGSADSDSESDSSSGLFWLHNCRKREPK